MQKECVFLNPFELGENFGSRDKAYWGLLHYFIRLSDGAGKYRFFGSQAPRSGMANFKLITEEESCFKLNLIILGN